MVYNNFTVAQNIAGTLSCFGCFGVVLTFFTFSSLRAKQYVQLVFFVALNDMLAAIGVAVGRTSNDVACWYEGISTNYNYLSSIFWITVISYKLYRLVLKCQKELDLGDNKKFVQIEIYDSHSDAVLDDMRVLHLICWGFPIIVTMLPLVDNYTYKNTTTDDDTTYATWCALESRKSDNKQDYELIIWKLVSFYLWVWLAVLSNVYLLYLTNSLIKNTFSSEKVNDREVIKDLIKDTMDKLKYYPLILIFCWMPSTIIDMAGYDRNIIGYSVATLLSLLQGFLSSMVFFLVNPDVRAKWYNLLCCRTNPFTEENLEAEEDRNDHNKIIKSMMKRNSTDDNIAGSFSSDVYWRNGPSIPSNFGHDSVNSPQVSWNNSGTVYSALITSDDV